MDLLYRPAARATAGNAQDRAQRRRAVRAALRDCGRPIGAGHCCRPIHPDTGKPLRVGRSGRLAQPRVADPAAPGCGAACWTGDRRRSRGPAPGEPIGSGSAMTRCSRSRAEARGADFPRQRSAALQSENRERRKPPLTDEELRSIARSAEEYDVGTPQAADGDDPRQRVGPDVEPVEWLWRHWSWRGKFHPPSGRRASVSWDHHRWAWLTSTIGGRWPDGSRL